MKTTNYTRYIAAIVILSLITATTAISQSRRYNRNSNEKTEKKDHYRNDRRNKGNQNYSQTNRNNHQNDRNESYRHPSKKPHYNKHYYTQKPHGVYYHRDKYAHNTYRKSIRVHHTYRHPHHGVVVKRFVHTPIVVNARHSRYYYCDGFYYKHVPRVGYIGIDMPYGVIVRELPIRHRRIVLNGSPYYFSGGMFFIRAGFGFRLVAPPVDRVEYAWLYNDDYYYDD